MSYGIPSISSKRVIDNFDAIKSSSLPRYKKNDELIKLIFKLKIIKNIVSQFQKKAYR